MLFIKRKKETFATAQIKSDKNMTQEIHLTTATSCKTYTRQEIIKTLGYEPNEFPAALNFLSKIGWSAWQIESLYAETRLVRLRKR